MTTINIIGIQPAVSSVQGTDSSARDLLADIQGPGRPRGTALRSDKPTVRPLVLAPDVDVPALAVKYELTGGFIKVGDHPWPIPSGSSSGLDRV